MTEPNYKSAIARALFETDEPISVVGRIRLDDEAVQVLHDGKWISGRYPDNIRVDRNTHFASTDAAGVHAHVYGRRDRDNALVVVRADGTKSHTAGACCTRPMRRRLGASASTSPPTTSSRFFCSRVPRG